MSRPSRLASPTRFSTSARLSVLDNDLMSLAGQTGTEDPIQIVVVFKEHALHGLLRGALGLLGNAHGDKPTGLLPAAGLVKQLLNSIGLRLQGRYQPEGSNTGVHPRVAMMKSKPASNGSLDGLPKREKRRKTRSAAATPLGREARDKWFLISAMKAAGFWPETVVPFRSLPDHDTSRVSSMKGPESGRSPSLPRCWVLCPFRAPCWLP